MDPGFYRGRSTKDDDDREYIRPKCKPPVQHIDLNEHQDKTFEELINMALEYIIPNDNVFISKSKDDVDTYLERQDDKSMYSIGFYVIIKDAGTDKSKMAIDCVLQLIDIFSVNAMRRIMNGNKECVKCILTNSSDPYDDTDNTFSVKIMYTKYTAVPKFASLVKAVDNPRDYQKETSPAGNVDSTTFRTSQWND